MVIVETKLAPRNWDSDNVEAPTRREPRNFVLDFVSWGPAEPQSDTPLSVAMRAHILGMLVLVMTRPVNGERDGDNEKAWLAVFLH